MNVTMTTQASLIEPANVDFANVDQGQGRLS